eukprot:3314797-Alexandrium_andersonii.AAC.1
MAPDALARLLDPGARHDLIRHGCGGALALLVTPLRRLLGPSTARRIEAPCPWQAATLTPPLRSCSTRATMGGPR